MRTPYKLDDALALYLDNCLSCGQSALLAATILLSVLFPLSHRYRVAQEQDLLQQRELLQWVQERTEKVAALRVDRNDTTPLVGATESLVAIVSGLAQQHALPVKRSTTEAEGALLIALTDARFEHTMAWLTALVTERTLVIDHLVLARGSQPGLVNVQIRLRQG